jgi:hypothetical protein
MQPFFRSLDISDIEGTRARPRTTSLARQRLYKWVD